MSYHQSKSSILNSLDNDYIEEGRRDIYEWGKTRTTNRKGLSGWSYSFKKMFIDKGIIKSFGNNLTAALVFQLILSGLITYICQRLDLYLDVNIALFVSPIVFPLAFSINADFQRREHVLEDLALFKGGLIILFFCHRDWHLRAGLSQEFLKASTNKLKGLILNIKEYLLTEKIAKRSFILQVIYEDFSDISQMNERLRVGLTDGASLVQRLIHCHNLMFWAFERLRVVREYRSPRGIRSFTKVFIFVMPLILSPYYVFVGKSSSNVWGPYYVSLISTFVFGTLQGVQDVLDDPFDGISEDDVNLGSLEDWTAHSLLTNRTYTIGRFTVTTSVKPKEKGEIDTIETQEASDTQERILSRNTSTNRKRIIVPVRSILRRAAHRTDVDRPDTMSEVCEQDVDTLYPEMALRLHSMKTKDLTGSTTILPGFHVKDKPCVANDSIAGTPVSIGRSKSDVSQAHARRRAFKKNVSFSKDFGNEINDTEPERTSDSSSNDDSPLIRQSAKDNIGFRYSDPNPDKIPDHLRTAFRQLENSKSTDRVARPKELSPGSKTPASLSSLFNPPGVGSQGDTPQNTPASTPSYLSATSEQGSTEKGQTNKGRQQPLIELPNVLVHPRSRFSVSNLEKSNSPENMKSITPPENKLPSKHSEQQSNDSTSLPVRNPNKDNEPKVSRFAVSPSAQSHAPGKVSPVNRVNHVNVQRPSATRFQVKKTRPAEEHEEKNKGQTNIDMTRISSSLIEDGASSTPNSTNHPSQPPNNIPTRTSLVKNNPPRKLSGKGFWDFDGSSIDLASGDPSVAEDEVDGKRKNSPESKNLGKRSSVEDVLDLSGNRSGEVYI